MADYAALIRPTGWLLSFPPCASSLAALIRMTERMGKWCGKRLGLESRKRVIEGKLGPDFFKAALTAERETEPGRAASGLHCLQTVVALVYNFRLKMGRSRCFNTLRIAMKSIDAKRKCERLSAEPSQKLR